MRGLVSFRLPSFLLILVLALGCSGSGSSSGADTSSGPESLSQEQLGKIAETIRNLEAKPLAGNAPQLRTGLFRWLTSSPDVTVLICGDLIEPLQEAESPYQAELLTQFLLSQAAYKIENPDASQVDVNTDGLRGALTSYRIYKDEKGASVENSFMETVAEQDAAGTLSDYVRSNLGEC